MDDFLPLVVGIPGQLGMDSLDVNGFFAGVVVGMLLYGFLDQFLLAAIARWWALRSTRGR